MPKQKHLQRLFILISVFSLGYTGLANAKTGIGLKVGTQGSTLELSKSMTPHVVTRFNANYFTYEADAEASDIDFTVPITLETYSLLVDWHPFRGGFHLSGGIVFNQNDFSLTAKGDEEIELNEQSYIGEFELEGKLKFRQTAPYLGLGWRPSPSAKGFGFTAELGVFFHGEPGLSLNAKGTAQETSTGSSNPVLNEFDVSNNPNFQENLNNETKAIEDEAKDDALYKIFSVIYPVINFGIIYKF